MNKSQIPQIFDSCIKQLSKHDFTGYDPADLMNTSYDFIKKLPSPIIRILTVVNFISPVNLRRILKIRPTKNTTAMVVLARALINRFNKTKINTYLVEAKELEKWIINNSIEIDGTIGWSRVIEYQSRRNFQHSSNSTLTFINASALEMYLDLYQITDNQYYLEIATKISAHLVNHTNRINYDFGCCLSYVSNASEEVLNASILAGAALNKFSFISNNNEARELSIRILDYCLYRQNLNGSWEYSYKKNNKPKKQYDFHQCYMLDGIMKYNLENDLVRIQSVNLAFASGMDFYFQYQFDNKMRPFWRYPIKYPIDIHNVSHAIFFVSKYFNVIQDASIKLDKLIALLFDSFYNYSGSYFYYHKYPFLTVKHNFFRWNTVWTLYALSHLNINEAN